MNPQPTTKKGIDLKNLIEGDLLELVGLSNISDQQKEKVMSTMMETLKNRVLFRIVEELGQDKEEDFFALLDKEDNIGIKTFLTKNKVDIENLVAEEALVYKKELMDIMA